MVFAIVPRAVTILYLVVRMYHDSAGERTAQLKREVTVPIARVAAVKFISRPP